MPDKVLIVLQGQIQIFSHHNKDGGELFRDENAFTVRVEPGSRIEAQISRGEEFGSAICHKEYERENVEFIGIECDLLRITSPYSYIVREAVYAYEIPSDILFKQLMDLNPSGLVALKQKASKKMKWYAQLSRTKVEREVNCESTFVAVRGDVERDNKMLAQVHKQYPNGDKNVSNVIRKIITMK
jgi:hypothetical protein